MISVPAIDDHLRARERVAFARREPEARHAGDARQRFAAKTERRDRREVVPRADFARRVPFQGQQRIVPIHPTPIINDPDECNSTAPDNNFNFARTRIDAVLDQLFHN